MCVSMAIRWLHRAVTVVLFVPVMGYLACLYMINGTKDDSLERKTQLSDSITLYVTQYNGRETTVSKVYRYYLGDNSLTLNQLRDMRPFLVTDNDQIVVSGYGNTVNVKLTGRVYSFSNYVLFFAQSEAVMPVINLNSIGVR